MYEERFRKGLQKYIEDSCLKQSAIADKASIRREVFSRILSGKRRIFAEEVAQICTVLDKTFNEILDYENSIGGDPEPKTG